MYQLLLLEPQRPLKLFRHLDRWRLMDYHYPSLLQNDGLMHRPYLARYALVGLRL